MNKQTIALAIILLLSITSVDNLVVVKATNNAASIESANSSIDLAFTNVLRAEKAGGNVTFLLLRLNNAGELLAEAENALRNENSTNITTAVDNALSIAAQVNNDALRLLNDKNTDSENNFLMTVIFSITAAVVFIAVLLVAWRRLKKNYTQKLMYSKPEITKNAT